MFTVYVTNITLKQCRTGKLQENAFNFIQLFIFCSCSMGRLLFNTGLCIVMFITYCFWRCVENWKQEWIGLLSLRYNFLVMPVDALKLDKLLTLFALTLTENVILIINRLHIYIIHYIKSRDNLVEKLRVQYQSDIYSLFWNMRVNNPQILLNQ